MNLFLCSFPSFTFTVLFSPFLPFFPSLLQGYIIYVCVVVNSCSSYEVISHMVSVYFASNGNCSLPKTPLSLLPNSPLSLSFPPPLFSLQFSPSSFHPPFCSHFMAFLSSSHLSLLFLLIAFFSFLFQLSTPSFSSLFQSLVSSLSLTLSHLIFPPSIVISYFILSPPITTSLTNVNFFMFIENDKMALPLPPNKENMPRLVK